MAKPLLAAVLVGALPAFSVAADPPNDLLQSLRSQLSGIRASTSARRVALEVLPEVQSLTGMSRKQLFSSLGLPDNCAPKAESQCMALASWVYAFVYLPQGWRGGGPELNVVFNQQGLVQEAQWKLSR
jgi:hypothetical protein